MPRSSQRSVSPSRFAMVPRVDVPRSAFDLSFAYKTTFDAGWLVPVYLEEVLPGDSIRCRMTALCRLSTPLVPIMDNLILESHFFFVPYRLVWEHWPEFMGETDAIATSALTHYVIPQTTLDAADILVGSLANFFGINNLGAGGTTISVSALPFRAYDLIWQEWFRDQDLQAGTAPIRDDGPDTFVEHGAAGYVLPRGKRHDYFTSARPWPRKPAPYGLEVSGPYTETAGGFYFPAAGAPVAGFGVAAAEAAVADATVYKAPGVRDVNFVNTFSSDVDVFRVSATGSGAGAYPDLRVLAQDIRMAEAIQVMMERNARGGTRYTEIVRTHFGVTSPDARLQRPEFLGGGRAHIVVNPVAQTSASGATGTTTVLGELAGVGTAVAQGHGFSQSFTEHGIIIGLVSVRADLSYQQGTDRMWWRRTKYDFYWPGLAHLSEQAIFSREIFCNGATGASGDASVFGYQARWEEYRTHLSRVTGRFRSNDGTPLDMWHLAEKFTSRPTLGDLFIQADAPVDRVLAIDTDDMEEFLFDAVFDQRMVRPLPMFSIPGLGPRPF